MFPALLGIAAIFAFQADSEPAKPAPLSVAENHDRIKNESQSLLTIGQVYSAPEEWKLRVDLSFGYTWSGIDRQPLKPTDVVNVQIQAVSSTSWNFEGGPELAILSGEQRIRVGGPDYDPKVEAKHSVVSVYRSLNGGAMTRGNTVKTMETRTTYLKKETLVWGVPFADLRRLADAGAEFAEVSVGDTSWRLDAAQMQAVRRWVARLSVSSADANRAEEEARKAQESAVAKARLRLDPVRPEFAKVVEKAERAKKAMPKRLYATAGEKAKWRAFDREVEPLVKKHNLSAADIEELLSDFPDFGARRTIE
jgi:hypothetical protein